MARAAPRARWWLLGWWLAIGAGVVLGVPRGAEAGQAEILDRILAIVEGRAILLSDLAAVLELELERTDDVDDPGAAVLQRLIDRELVLAEVERYVRAAAMPGIVEDRFQTVRDRYGSTEDFETVLERLGLGETQLRNRIRDDLRIEAYLNQRFGSTARPTDEAILQYYRDNRAEFVRSDEIVPLAEAESLIRGRVEAEQRRALIAEWTLDLRRRATIILPGRAQR